jgi:hypothetical protein
MQDWGQWELPPAIPILFGRTTGVSVEMATAWIRVSSSDGPDRPRMSRQCLPQPPRRPAVAREEVERNLNAHGADW